MTHNIAFLRAETCLIMEPCHGKPCAVEPLSPTTQEEIELYRLGEAKYNQIKTHSNKAIKPQ